MCLSRFFPFRLASSFGTAMMRLVNSVSRWNGVRLVLDTFNFSFLFLAYAGVVAGSPIPMSCLYVTFRPMICPTNLRNRPASLSSLLLNRNDSSSR